jgi:hypothetical protein
MSVYIAPIVEGHGEVVSLPPLLHRIWSEQLFAQDRLEVFPPHLAKQGQLLQPDGRVLGACVQAAFARVQAKLKREPNSTGLVLLLLDAETLCPATLGPRLLATATAARPDAVISCVLAKRMFENWLVAGASTLGGVNGLPAALVIPALPEHGSGKAWFDQAMRSVQRNRSYSEIRDCLQFVRPMDLATARIADSFDKLCRELEKLIPPPPQQPPPDAPT